jgi:succinoglycan biosynthesis transport protein ExoP
LLERGNENASITILKNKGGDNSLMEIAIEDEIRDKLNHAKSLFDLILIDTTALNESNQAKEWIAHSDAVVGVFRAGKVLSDKKLLTVEYFKSIKIFKGWILNKKTA